MTESPKNKKLKRAYHIGPAIAATVPPGSCVFGEEWSSAPLVSKVAINHDTKVFTFGLEDAKPLGLSTCACILAKGGADGKGEPFIRPYTPVSTNAMHGAFELMVKIYPEGNMSRHLDSLAVGSTVDFKHIPFNVKTQYPFNKRKLAMLVGGTGVAPMIQALHAVLGNAEDTTEVSMLYGSRTEQDILAKDALADWCSEHHGRITVTHVLSNEPEGSSWEGARGFIDRALIEKHFPGPKEDCAIFVCGPPPMYDALCGPRGDKELTGVLAEIGYSSEQVHKF